MRAEHIYPILYDLVVTIGSELSERPLIRRIMQRLMLHTGLPAALWLERQAQAWDVSHMFGVCSGEIQPERFPYPISSGWVDDRRILSDMGLDASWQSLLVLQVDHERLIVMLSKRLPDTSLPWAQVFQPIMGNLRTALHLCRLNDEQTEKLANKVTEQTIHLRESEERFRDLAEQAPISIQIFRADGTCLLANSAWERLWNASFEQLVDYNLFEDEQLVAGGQMENIMRAFSGEHVFVDAHSYNPACNKNYEHPDRELWLRANIFPLRNNRGDVTHVVVMHEDISAWKEADHRLQESERRYRNLVSLIPDGIGLCRDGSWLMANPAMIKAFGATSMDALKGTPVVERIHPAYRGQVPVDGKWDVAGGKEKFEGLIQMLRMDDSEFWAEIQLQPFTTEEGMPSILVVLRDVTDRVRVERENALLRTAIEQGSDPIMLLNTEGHVLLANPAAAHLYGVELSWMLGRSVDEFQQSMQDGVQFSHIQESIHEQKIWTGEITVEVDGKKKIISRRVSPVYDSQGNIHCQIVMDRDISEERQRQEKMAHMQRLESLGVLAGGIAHDFNNLLGIIMGNASLARSQVNPVDDLAEFLENIETTSHRASHLCKQMLAYSGKGKFVIRPINLSQIVEEMGRLLEVSIHKTIVLRYELCADIPAIEADVAQMQQVIMNLVINASEAIGENNGTIVLSTGVMDADSNYLSGVNVEDYAMKAGKYVWIEVSDTGCGMDEQTKMRLFEPFFTTKFTGRGLGMSAILGIVRGHRGAIKVYSEMGKGTTIKILFPAVEAKPVKLQLSEEHPVMQKSSGKILVVDDEEMIRDVACMILKKGGFEVIEAKDGMDAIDKLKSHGDEIVCVLLDMMMPEMGGEEAFSEMRRIKPDIKVLLSSGYNEQTATNRFAGKGLAGFIQKPYTVKGLLSKVSELLGRTSSIP